MMKQMVRSFCFGLTLAFVSVWSMAAETKSDSSVTIDNARGVDSSLDYTSLLQLGPWDDRNYNLRRSDLDVIPNFGKDRYIPGVPAFFKVQKRKEAAAEGFPIGKYYPREFNKEFQYRYGGLLQNGTLKRKGLGIYSHPDPNNPPEPVYFATDPVITNLMMKAVPVVGERPFDGTRSDNETAIEYHPTNPSIIIAGSNGVAGQQMSRSLDGGLTWNTGLPGTQSLALPGSCCDPAMDWSPDGTIAYAATLTFVGGTGSANIRVQVYWSFNNGGTWLGPVQLSSAGSDKEYIHVDKNPASPFFGRAYVCWHQGNVQFFSRSTQIPVDGGAPMTFATPTSFSSDERGIGCDITTDAAGRVYFFYPSVTDGSAEVRLLRSSDGGVTFDDLNGGTSGLANTVYDLHGEFDFAVPSMESRRAFIYVAADVDQSGGPRNGRIYAAFADENQAAGSPGGGTGSASASHGWVRVVYSDDQGVTWTTAATPHSVADQTTVDRYNPWMDVDTFGNIHVGFYDTRNSGAGLRDKVDWYYVYSPDGGTTWLEETRVSAGTSQNIADGQEWGDYNGLSLPAGANTVGMTWTDNRQVSGVATQRSFFGEVQNLGAGPTYVMSGGSNVDVCAGTSVPPEVFTITGFSGFNQPVTLSTPGLNNTVFPTAAFTTNPVTPTPTPGSNTTLNLTTSAGAAAGLYTVNVSATNGGGSPIVRNSSFTVNLASGTPAAVSLTAPADGATGVGSIPTFTWAAVPGATSYTIEVATDSGFTAIVASGSPTTTSFTPGAALAANTLHYWRVRANSPCGNGSFGTARSFTTANEICVAPGLAIPDNNATGVNSNIVVPGVAGTLNDLNVKVQLTHTWTGDLRLRLTRTPTAGSPTTVELAARVGGSSCQTDNMDATLDDEAATLITACAGSFTGSFRPANPLTGFDTQDLGATWSLNVADLANADTGTLTRWCLVPSVTAPGPDANLAVSMSGPASQVQGQPISYTVTVTNAGPDNATSFAFGDAVPAAITGVTVNCVANGTATCGTNATAGNNVSFTGNALNSGAGNSLVFTISGTVDSGFTGALSNSASVTSVLPGDFTTANNTATHNVTVSAATTAIFADNFE